MLTIAETRRARLEELIDRFDGKIADLNAALGYTRNDTRLARIRNANQRKDRPGKVFQMGDAQAREIEVALALERGWMDTPPGFEYAGNEKVQQLHRVAEALEPYQIDQLIAFVASIGPRLPNSDEAERNNQIQTPVHDSGERRGGLSPVQSGQPQTIGAGHFGPPDKGRKEGARNRGKSSKSREGVRQRNAGGR
jgi:hypothetical protein